MDKKQILEKSQEENEGKDIADLDAQKKGNYIGSVVTGILALVAIGVDACIFKRIPWEILTLISIFLATLFIYKYASLRKRHELFTAICYFAIAIMFLSLYVLQLCGVMR